MVSDKAANKAKQSLSFRHHPKQQRSQARVEKILQAAAKVFWDVGYDAATTHAIAQQANTAVGTLYRFFPNKLAIFHALEKRHRQGVEDIQAQLMSPEVIHQPLSDMIRQMVETFAKYFESLGPRVVYIQYYDQPELYAQFDESVDYSYIRRFAIALRIRNPKLPIEKSELIAEVCHRSFNALFLRALRSEPQHRDHLYQELQTLLINYLQTYDAKCHKLSETQLADPSTAAPIASDPTYLDITLNPRQQVALSHIQQHGHLTIQTFEALCPERSRRTLQRDLKRLVSEGLLITTGDTNQLTYRPPAGR
ncbi:MAG: TetR family transcriptional regulator [Phormidesmis sp.]